ncbi:alpha/beta hydrolase [Blattabacterium cuenoti]|uniref:alpha/beta hydrolase n=1 Tax=Blattabacterium cuenoti TaxID=1653831 RepID=UPI00163BAB43|nr:phospholipase [Blattabacterium cuenoti]
MLLDKLSIKHKIKEPIKNKIKHPLFLMIHGYGSNEKDIFSFHQDIPDSFFIISIQGLNSIGLDKYSWYDIDFNHEEKFINILQAKKTIEKISFFIDEAIKEYNLLNQVWLCGFSQGAILSYAIAIRKYHKVKKIIALSGYLEKRILPKTIEEEAYKNLDFFISHGIYDPIIPISWSKKSFEFLKKKKVLSVLYKEYDSGHTLCNSNYNDLINWIKIKKQKY